MKTLIFLLISLTSSAQVQELFRGEMFIKTIEGCTLKEFRMGGYKSNLYIEVDYVMYQFTDCLQNTEKNDGEMNILCRDICGANYEIKMYATKEGLLIYLNNLLNSERTVVISTGDICRE